MDSAYHSWDRWPTGIIPLNVFWAQPDRAEWEKWRSVALVESEREVHGERRVEQRVFVCRLAANAALLAQAVRGHWGIENQLLRAKQLKAAWDHAYLQSTLKPGDALALTLNLL